MNMSEIEDCIMACGIWFNTPSPVNHWSEHGRKMPKVQVIPPDQKDYGTLSMDLQLTNIIIWRSKSQLIGYFPNRIADKAVMPDFALSDNLTSISLKTGKSKFLDDKLKFPYTVKKQSALAVRSVK